MRQITPVTHYMNWTIFHEQVFPIRHKLYRFALRITGSVHEAEDVVQEVLEKVWKTAPDQTENVQNWEAWCGLHERKTDLISPADAAESRDLAAGIRKMMQELPEKQRLVMHLRDIEELSYDEIAETLSISLEQVKINLYRARKTIRERMLEKIEVRSEK